MNKHLYLWLLTFLLLWFISVFLVFWYYADEMSAVNYEIDIMNITQSLFSSLALAGVVYGLILQQRNNKTVIEQVEEQRKINTAAVLHSLADLYNSKFNAQKHDSFKEESEKYLMKLEEMHLTSVYERKR